MVTLPLPDTLGEKVSEAVRHSEAELVEELWPLGDKEKEELLLCEGQPVLETEPVRHAVPERDAVGQLLLLLEVLRVRVTVMELLWFPVTEGVPVPTPVGSVTVAETEWEPVTDGEVEKEKEALGLTLAEPESVAACSLRAGAYPGAAAAAGENRRGSSSSKDQQPDKREGLGGAMEAGVAGQGGQ